MKKQKRTLKTTKSAAPVAPAKFTKPGVSFDIILVCLLLIAITLPIYLQTAGHGFSAYDDWAYVSENANVKAGLTATSVSWAFTSTEASNWHPLTWLSHILDWQIYGDKAGGHHVTNVILHVFSVLLIFILLSKMTGFMWRSAFVAAVFGAHPLRVESVAWIAERKDVLSAFFWLLTILVYVWYSREPTAKRRWTVVVIYALGLMAKPMLVTLPFVLLLLDYWPLGRLMCRGESCIRPGRSQGSPLQEAFLEKLPLFALSAASCIITFVAQRGGGSLALVHSIPFASRVENALVAYVAYIGKTLWPANLAVIYPHPGTKIEPLPVLLAFVILAIISFFALRMWRRAPYLAVGWLWFLGTLIPVIGLVQVGQQAMADRYTYLPTIGLLIIIAWGLPTLLARWQAAPKILAAFAVFATIALAWAAYDYTSDWRSSSALFERALASTKNNHIAEAYLGQSLEVEGKPDLALEHYRKAISIDPTYAPAQGNLATMLLTRGDIAGALEHSRLALESRPDVADTHYNYGVILQQAGRLQEAEKEFRETIRLYPLYLKAHGNLGNVLLAQRRIDEAISCFKQVQLLNPQDPIARKRIDLARSLSGLLTQVRTNPNDARARNELSMVLYHAGDYAGSWKEVHWLERAGFAPNPDLMKALRKKMPEARD